MMTLRTVLQGFYRFFFVKVLKRKRFLKYFFSESRISAFQRKWNASSQAPLFRRKLDRIWFHASSVGELESLWSLIFAASERGSEIIVTVFSESAQSAQTRLAHLLKERHASVLFIGYCPWEGEWRPALQALQPTLFVTAKYEAWPELWMSLASLEIPLVMISASARKSLSLAKRICGLLIGRLPSLFLFPCVKEEITPLHRIFPEARIEALGEPRWDRVFERAQVGNSRAKELKERFQFLKRPWGILGSAWIEDLEFFKPVLAEIYGTLWVIPHDVGPSNTGRIEQFLQDEKFKVIRTSSFFSSHSSASFSSDPPSKQIEDLAPSEPKRPCVLVDEMGFLLELYASADWAFVGGGFGVGLHSTIEPALYGIPVGAGPQGSTKFAEVPILTASGQLTLLDQREALQSWIQEIQANSPRLREVRVQWMHEARNRLGATRKILGALEKLN